MNVMQFSTVIGQFAYRLCLTVLRFVCAMGLKRCLQWEFSLKSQEIDQSSSIILFIFDCD